MIDKDFCLSSYIAFRYIWRDDMDFMPGMHHRLFESVPAKERIGVKASADIDREIQRQFDDLYRQYNSIGILLSRSLGCSTTS